MLTQLDRIKLSRGDTVIGDPSGKALTSLTPGRRYTIKCKSKPTNGHGYSFTVINDHGEKKCYSGKHFSIYIKKPW